MIDVSQVLLSIPHFESFCSVEKLHSLVEKLRTHSPEFIIEVAGTSVNGLPIYHVRFGKGSIRALVVAFPHCNEPVGGLTVFSLLTLLAQGNPQLVDVDIEWNIVPCIDPDGALLNEGWSQQPFTVRSYMRSFYKQEVRDQVEMSFPIKHKRLSFDSPIKEASILKRLLERIRPDFYYSLHNAMAGGAFYLLNRDIDHKYHQQLYNILEQHHIALQPNPHFSEWCSKFGPGIKEHFTTKKYYDFLAKTLLHPEKGLNFGATSWEYLAGINEGALSFVSELPYVKHPSDGSRDYTGQNLRQLKLRLDAENKYIVSVILEEWEKVKDSLDSKSPFYRKILNGMVTVKERLPEGLPWWPDATRDILFNAAYSRTITEGERFHEHEIRYYLLCNCYEFVRLLKASEQTPEVKKSLARTDAMFEAAVADIAQQNGFDQFESIDCDSLAKVQLGSGLIVLNSLLEARAPTAAATVT